MRRSMFALCVGVTSLLFSSGGFADLPTSDEILEIHRANQESLKSLHLRWTHVEERTGAARRADRKQTEEKARLTREVRQMNPNDLRIQVGNQTYVGEAALRFLEQGGAILTRRELEEIPEDIPAQAFVSAFELFRSGDRYQVRSRNRRDEQAEPSELTFPEGPVTAETLRTTYRDCNIFCWSPAATPPGSCWFGGNGRGQGQGQITSEHFRAYRLPPGTAFLNADWGGRHAYDHFFSRPVKEYRVVRQEEVEGRTLTVVDVRVPIGTPPTLWLGYRGWLDLGRGAVPLRMGHSQVTGNAPVDMFDRRTSFPEMLTTKVVRELPGGTFYPATVTRERFAPDPDPPAGEPDAQVVHGRDAWTASLVEIMPDRPAEFFVLPFPADSPIYDKETGRLVGALPRQPLVKVGQKAPGLEAVRWVDGRKRTLESLRGQVVVLEFWDAASDTCKQLVPIRNELRKEFAKEPVVFLDIHVGTKDSAGLPARIAEFQKTAGWNGTTAIDSGTMADNSVTTVAYGARFLPLLVIIDKEGNLAYVDPQDLDDEAKLVLPGAEEELERKMNAILQTRFEVAEESWPVDETLSDEEQLAIHRRVEVRYLSRVIRDTIGSSKP